MGFSDGGEIGRIALNQREAAEALGISPRFLFELTKTGKVPHVRLGGRVLYPVRDLEEFVSQRVADSIELT